MIGLAAAGPWVALGSLAAATIVVALAAPWMIRVLTALDHRQHIREDAPGRHQAKAGTPTMGGLLMIAAIAVVALGATTLGDRPLFVLVALVAFGGVGLLDDLRKVRRKRNLGLRARERLGLQLLLGLGLGVWATRLPGMGTTVPVPWWGAADLGLAHPVVAGLLIVGFANAVNLSDGLDGLAAQLVAVAAAGLAGIAAVHRAWDSAAVAAGVTGACLGFLPFNRYPARVFMGDVGSNALGAALAALGLLLRVEVALFLIGGVFIAEAASVFLQVAYFKLTGGRRIFRMSPLHHHFELAGWSEPAVVRRFTLAGGLCALLGAAVVLA